MNARMFWKCAFNKLDATTFIKILAKFIGESTNDRVLSV